MIMVYDSRKKNLRQIIIFGARINYCDQGGRDRMHVLNEPLTASTVYAKLSECFSLCVNLQEKISEPPVSILLLPFINERRIC